MGFLTFEMLSSHICAGEVMHFVSGTENADEDHAASLVTLAEELMAMAASMAMPNGRPLQLQMGLHTGQVVTGVVGNLALKYGCVAIPCSPI